MQRPAQRDPPASEDVCARFFAQIEKIEQDVIRVRAETDHLNRTKAQSEIHLRAFRRDYDSLQSIYKMMKTRLAMLTDGAHEEVGRTQTHNTHEKPPEQPSNPHEKYGYDQTGKPTTSVLAHIERKFDVVPMSESSRVSLGYTLSSGSVLCAIRFDSTGRRFAFADGRTVFLISTVDGSLLGSFDIRQVFTQGEIHTRALCFSPDDQYIAITAPKCSVHIFSVASRSLVTTLDEHTMPVSSLLFLRDHDCLLSGGFDGVLTIWDTRTWNKVRQIPRSGGENDAIAALAVSYDQTCVAVGFMDGSIGLYDPGFTQPMAKLSAHEGVVLGMSAAHKSLLFATTAQDKTVKLWNLRGVASCKMTLTGHTDVVLGACFSPNDEIVLSGGKDEKIKVWDAKNGTLMFTISAHENTLFEIDHHPTEKCFVSCAGDGLVCLWKYV